MVGKSFFLPILFIVPFLIITFCFINRWFDSWIAHNWESPNYAITTYSDVRARKIAVNHLKKDFGIILEDTDKIPFMVCCHFQREFLYVLEPHEGFDYRELINRILSDKYQPKGYVVRVIEDNEPMRSAQSSGEFRRNSNPKLYWWRPDYMADDVKHFSIRLVPENIPSSKDQGYLAMIFYISKEDQRIYVNRSALSFTYQESNLKE